MNICESKICLTAFFFGKFNNYFPLWLHSCRYNSSINFILFTDNNDPYEYPSNVKKMVLSFEEFRVRCQKKYDFNISMQVPYDICDYVPAFGDIFSEELKAYDFWGHCDIDLIFGNIRNFLPETILSKYDKISWRGHFSLYKNTQEINTIYKSPYYGIELYKTIFTNPSNSLFALEENEINNMLEENGYKIYKALKFADLETCTNNFEMMHFSDSFQDTNKSQIFEFKNGNLLRHYVKNGKLYSDEFMYVHFLKRPMSIDKNFQISNNFLIRPNHFSNMQDITVSSVLHWSKKKIYFSYYLDRLNFRYYRRRKTNIEDIKIFKNLYGHLNRKEFKVIIDEQPIV